MGKRWEKMREKYEERQTGCGEGQTEYEGRKFEKLSLESENLEGMRFADCEFHKCEFFENKLTHCQFKNCTFQGCVIVNNEFRFTEASGNVFLDCTIIGMNWDRVTKPHTIFMPFEKFEKCCLKYNVFYKLKLCKMNLRGCDLQGSFFEECDLSGADFRECNLRETVFAGDNLTGADFRDAREYVISPESNRVRKAKFSFPEVMSLLRCLEIEVE